MILTGIGRVNRQRAGDEIPFSEKLSVSLGSIGE
jgi:hypothetical protein